MLVTALFGLIHSPLAVLTIPLLAVEGVTFAAPALVAATVAKVENHLFYYIALFVTPLSYMSGTFFPVDRLPQWLKDVIWLTPLFHFARLTRGFYAGDFPSEWLLDLAVIAVWLAIFVPIAARALRGKLIS
jgi:lipooligosaccharide transport system permease protein